VLAVTGVVALLTAFHVAVTKSLTPQSVHALVGAGAARGTALSALASIPAIALGIVALLVMPQQWQSAQRQAASREEGIRASGFYQQLASADSERDLLLANMIDEQLHASGAEPPSGLFAFVIWLAYLGGAAVVVLPFLILAQWLLGPVAEKKVRKRLVADP
jgi:hypothetical protein